jgi:hypothetical protein
MNKRINVLRLRAGISRLEDDSRLVVINQEGKAIDPLIGLQKFADLIVQECLHQIVRCTLRNGDSEHNLALYKAMDEIKEHFGVE